ncbi:hypothetical protein K438DRAFT_1773546 [Mycena galopus ATCC 62051]|nr:hypothetical protein K438DRAFT_1773546 [Mycena galopus ATCC 62051]
MRRDHQGRKVRKAEISKRTRGENRENTGRCGRYVGRATGRPPLIAFGWVAIRLMNEFGKGAFSGLRKTIIQSESYSRSIVINKSPAHFGWGSPVRSGTPRARCTGRFQGTRSVLQDNFRAKDTHLREDGVPAMFNSDFWVINAPLTENAGPSGLWVLNGGGSNLQYSINRIKKISKFDERLTSYIPDPTHLRPSKGPGGPPKKIHNMAR